MERRQIVVEDGLDERAGGRLVDGKVVMRTRHARTRFVAMQPPLIDVVPSDRWTAPLVAARLKRIAAIFRRDRRARGFIEEWKSCMPEPILNRSQDYAPTKTVPRPPLTAAQIDFAVTTYQVVLRIFSGDEDAHGIVWCIANRQEFAEAAESLNRATWRARRDWTARAVRYRWAEVIGPKIADLFNALRVPIEAEDVTLAESNSFHRNI